MVKGGGGGRERDRDRQIERERERKKERGREGINCRVIDFNVDRQKKKKLRPEMQEILASTRTNPSIIYLGYSASTSCNTNPSVDALFRASHFRHDTKVKLAEENHPTVSRTTMFACIVSG